MLVKWTYVTKSYAGKILTSYLEQNDNYTEACPASFLPNIKNSDCEGQESSEVKDKESLLPLRPLQNYQEQLWNYQKLKHQSRKQVTYRVVLKDRFQALNPKSKSGTEVTSNNTESEKLRLRRKWLSSLGKYGNEKIMQRTGLECWVINEKMKTERGKTKVCRQDYEKENDVTGITSINPRVLHYGQEKDPTRDKRYRRNKETVLSFHPCYTNKGKPLDSLERSLSRSQGTRNAHSSDSQSDLAEGRQSSSKSTPKVDFDKTREREERRIGKDGSSHRRNSFNHKKEQDAQEHESDRGSCKTLDKHVKKGKANFLKGGSLFRGQEKGSPSGVVQEIEMSRLEMNPNRPLNKKTQNGDEVSNSGSRCSTCADSKEVEIMHLVTLRGDVDNKRRNKIKNDIENKDDNKTKEVDLVKRYATTTTTTTTTNNNNNNNDVNTNNNAEKPLVSSNNGITKTKDANASKKSLVENISTNTRKNKPINKENTKQNDGNGYSNKNKPKLYGEKRFKKVSKINPSLDNQSQNPNVLSKTETASCLELSESLQEKQVTLKTSHGLKNITTVHKKLVGAQNNNNKDASQEKNILKVGSCLEVGESLQEKQGTLKTSHGLKDIITVHKKLVSGQNNNNKDASQEKNILKVGSKSEKLGAGRNSESAVMGQNRCKKSLEDDSCKDAKPEITMLWPLKKIILMRELNREELEVLEENQKPDRSCQNLHPLFQSYSLQKNFNKKYKVYCNDCSDILIPPVKVKVKDSKEASESTDAAEIDTTVSHYNQRSAGALASLSPSLTSVERCTSPRHPKKTLLDTFRKKEKESIEVNEGSIRDRVAADAAVAPSKDTLVSSEGTRHKTLNAAPPKDTLVSSEGTRHKRSNAAPSKDTLVSSEGTRHKTLNAAPPKDTLVSSEGTRHKSLNAAPPKDTLVSSEGTRHKSLNAAPLKDTLASSDGTRHKSSNAAPSKDTLTSSEGTKRESLNAATQKETLVSSEGTRHKSSNAPPPKDTLVSSEGARQESSNIDIPKERLVLKLRIPKSNHRNVVSATNSETVTNEPAQVQRSDDGVPDKNERLENSSSQLLRLYDRKKSMTDSSSRECSTHREIDSDFPFAFRLECIYSIDKQRVGYVHRKIPAISIPYILIGTVEFVTVRSALKLFSNFDEKFFVKSFFRNDRQTTCQTTCSKEQALKLRKINTIPELEPVEGEDLIPIGPLIYNFHRFKEAMRRLRNRNKQTVQSQFYHSVGQ